MSSQKSVSAARNNYYTNPAFCQQSEFYTRQPPVGAQTPSIHHEVGSTRERARTPDYEEQQFYEEMYVDDSGVVQHKNVLVLSSPSGKAPTQYPPSVAKHRYEYIPLREHDIPQHQEKRRPAASIPATSYPIRYHRYAVISGMDDADTDGEGGGFERERSRSPGRALSPTQQRKQRVVKHGPSSTVVAGGGGGGSGRYALVPLEEIGADGVLNTTTDSTTAGCHGQSQGGRYAVVTEEELQSRGRYDYIPDPLPKRQQCSPQRPVIPANPVATQKLHELLTTPRKTPTAAASPTVRAPQTPQHHHSHQQRGPNAMLSPVSPRKPTTPSISPSTNANGTYMRTMAPTPGSRPYPPNLPRGLSLPQQHCAGRNAQTPPPRAQQKLNYALGSRLLPQHAGESVTGGKRTTAIVAPVCSSPVQSVYAETTYGSGGSGSGNESWKSGHSGKALSRMPSVQATMVIAALMLVLCGTVTVGLCFYMISILGRMYYLDFGAVAGFACMMLGIMGCRGNDVQFLPNRHYISGYIILSIFSLGTCSGLLVLLFLQPKAGSALADITSGAVCGLSALSLVVAAMGVISSYCCRFPPPDNRVEHCARGFSV